MFAGIPVLHSLPHSLHFRTDPEAIVVYVFAISLTTSAADWSKAMKLGSISGLEHETQKWRWPKDKALPVKVNTF